ncbi:acetylcholine receptor subunit alpha-1-A-like [Saccostrea cucullata]|uniref:acetylcholine receptor subunit alpha-1-A-like n=1 Tax=Saccostrea cuccullata TaxID=36930 RepID=UPI002ED06C4A
MLVIFPFFITMMSLWPSTSSSESQLRKDILQNYMKELRPNVTQMVINISFSVFHLIGFDDKNGKFTINGYLGMSWTDSRIAKSWAFSEASEIGTSTMYFKESDVWTPEIRQKNHYSRSDFEKVIEETVIFHKNGSAVMMKMDVFTMECTTFFSFFPFDTQNCSIDVLIWGFFNGEIALNAPYPKVNMKLFSEDNVWHIRDTRINVESVYGLGINDIYQVPRAKIESKILRSPSYYVTCLIVPLIFMQCLQSCVFLMPWDCGERASFAVTVLLAIALFLTMVTEHIPKAAKTHFSFLGIKMIFDLLVGIMIQISAIIIQLVYYQSRRSEPKFFGVNIIRVVLNVICSVVCRVCDDGDFKDNEDNDQEQKSEIWIERGNKMDKFCFWFANSLTLISILFFCVVVGSSDY